MQAYSTIKAKLHLINQKVYRFGFLQYMEKLTAIIPVFNEQDTIERAIVSVLFADEILIVDSFSTDLTLSIAEKYDVKIIQRDYEYSASQKNWAIPQASNNWILILDADEVIGSSLREEIQSILNKKSTKTGYWIYRNNHFMNQAIKYSGWQNDKVVRLFQRDLCRYEDKRVHAEIITSGDLGFLNSKIDHFTYKSLRQYVEKLNRYAALQAIDYDKITDKITAYHLLLKPLWRFLKHFIIQKGYKDGVAGTVICFLQAYAVVMRYANLYLLRKKN
ncbi:glycosyltransferase family 2 protein [Leeuwenhoekiella parthenopeia]|nr:glycosyltransferase family 2 protein [Leeuwenhoekiella parthenopeia]